MLRSLNDGPSLGRVPFPILLLDLAIVIAAALSGVMWLRASRGKLRRVTAGEECDHHDFNRMVVAFNRSQLLNRRAALATAAAALLGALRMSIELIP